VLVVSDRTVLDAQLQEAIFDFERTTGVVATINGESASKSAQLGRRSVGHGKKIMVCTIQTFPFALQAAQELAATEGQALRGHRGRGAQLPDRARPRPSSRSAVRPRSSSPSSGRRRGGHRGLCWPRRWRPGPANPGLTYVAFTATPKAKTLELFGRLPDPTKPEWATCPAFHVYSMRQAIEEGFILDVLKNYTPTSSPSNWRTTVRNSTRRRSSAARR
jgi:type I restriction enzyme R subunit